MGYSTDYMGKLSFKNKLTEQEYNTFCEFKEKLEEDKGFEFDVTEDLLYMEWDCTEKTYDVPERLESFIKAMLDINNDFELNGELLCQGENIYDRYKIKVIKNKVSKEIIEDNILELKLYSDKEQIWLNNKLVQEEERLSFFDLEQYKYISQIKVNSYD